MNPGFWKRALALIIPSMFFVCFFAWCTNKATDTDKVAADLKKNEKIDSFYMAQQFIEPQLKSPSSAKFGSMYDCGEPNQNQYGSWVVNCYVDSQNGFGVMIRTKYQVTLARANGTTWQLKEQKIW